MIYDDLWWFMMIYDDLWWFMMIYDDSTMFWCNLLDDFSVCILSVSECDRARRLDSDETMVVPQ